MRVRWNPNQLNPFQCPSLAARLDRTLTQIGGVMLIPSGTEPRVGAWLNSSNPIALAKFCD